MGTKNFSIPIHHHRERKLRLLKVIIILSSEVFIAYSEACDACLIVFCVFIPVNYIEDIVKYFTFTVNQIIV